MDDALWIDKQRQMRIEIMDELAKLEKEVRALNKKLYKEPQIDAGYKRKLEMIQANWKILLSITDKKLANLSQKAELEHALDKIKKEVEAIAEANKKGRAYTFGDVKRDKPRIV